MTGTPDSTTRVLRQNQDVASSRLGDTGVLVHLRTNRIFELNATGLRAWEIIGTGCAEHDVLEQLQREFDVDSERVRLELTPLVEAMVREGLLDVETR
jgi:hypothetical protein